MEIDSIECLISPLIGMEPICQWNRETASMTYACLQKETFQDIISCLFQQLKCGPTGILEGFSQTNRPSIHFETLVISISVSFVEPLKNGEVKHQNRLSNWLCVCILYVVCVSFVCGCVVWIVCVYVYELH